MRVLQLIDSLDPGGAEKMAIYYANNLCGSIDESYLCTTRKEGILKYSIDPKVSYLYLNKKSTLDIKAIAILVSFIKKNKISLIHAHATSFFLATIVKLYHPKIKIIWHDHYGKSEELNKRDFKILKWCSYKFCAIISVNHLLVDWARKNLKTKMVYYLANAVAIPTEEKKSIKLNGQKGKRIVCLANMRPQKDHINLLDAFKMVINKHPEYSLHLIGMNWNDTYFKKINDLINQDPFKGHVFYYGSQTNVISLLKQCDIGVLSSNSEGLPLALLEYGMTGLGIVCTDVGECRDLVNGFGKCISSKNSKDLAKAINYYIEHPDEMNLDLRNFTKHIEKNYSIRSIIPKLVSYYETCT